MPNYTFFCESCSNKFEIFLTIKEYKEHPKCSLCESKKTYRSYQDDICTGFVKKTDAELSTIGDLANRNRDRMSDDQKQSLYVKHNEYKDSAFQKELPSGMSRMKKPKQKTKWY
jgi:putative FmdB family regulatory protein